MKKLFLITILFLSSISIYSQFNGGLGTAVSPYLISNKEDMEELADSVAQGNYWSSGKYFELTNNITDSVETSVGEIVPYGDITCGFSGHFDGKNYKITLKIIRNTPMHAAAFGFIINNATIQNLVVDGIVKSSPFAAGIVGQAHNSNIINCINFCNVEGIAETGGIAGRIVNCDLINCINLGTISNTHTQIGGITGDGVNYTNISNTLNLGKVISNCIKVGGINGDITNDDIVNCINAAYIPNGNSIYGDNSNTGMQTSISIGVTQHSVVSYNCFFDKQMSIETISPQGKFTTEMTGTALQSFLGTTNWNYEDSLYPRLKNMPIEEPGYVGAAPVFLRVISNSNYDTYNNVRYCFNVSNKHGVQWRSSNGKVEINNTTGKVKLLALGWDTLTAYLMTKYGHEATKIIPINITDLINDCYTDTFNLFTLSDTTTGDAFLTGEYLDRTKVEISAVAKDCYHFVRWEDKLGNTLPFKQIDTVTINSDSTIIAIFEKNSFELELNVEPFAVGIVSKAGYYFCDDTATLTANANDSCYKFEYWEDAETKEKYYDSTIKIKMDTNKKFTAHFVLSDLIYLELQTDPPNINNGTDIMLLGDGLYSFCNSNTIIDAYIFNDCFVFKYWSNKSGDTISKEISSGINLNSDSILVAHFDVFNYTVSLIPNPTNGGLVNNSNYFIDTISCGDSIIINAIPNNNFKFINWTDSITGEIISENPTDTLLKAENNKHLIANFKILDSNSNFLNLLLNIEPTNSGKVTGNGIYKENTIVTITAEANECYIFKHWKDKNGTIISDLPKYTFTLTSDSNLIAVFIKIECLVNIYPKSAFMGKIEGDISGLYYCGKLLQFKAISLDSSMYEFTCWTNENNDTLGKIEALNIILKGDTTIIANFISKDFIVENDYNYNINIVPNPTDNDFKIIFENPDLANIKIELININGIKILDIYEGTEQVGTKNYKVDKKLLKGIYFIKLTINNKTIIRKLQIK